MDKYKQPNNDNLSIYDLPTLNAVITSSTQSMIKNRTDFYADANTMPEPETSKDSPQH